MRLFVKVEAEHSMIGLEDIRRGRAVVAEASQRIMASGKVNSSGIFPDCRGGYFDLDVESSEELLELLGDVVDFVRLETHPVADMSALAAVLQQPVR